MTPLISVIVPVFNVESMLNTCVKSIVDQSYKNLEIILIDDGSTDSSSSLCDQWKNLDPRICVIHKQNGGLSDARNVGLSKARGDFLSFIDSDDFLHADFFYDLINLSKEHNADIVSSDLCFYHNEMDLQNLSYSNNIIKVYNTEEAEKEYLSPKHDRIIYHGLCMKIYKKNLFDNLLFEKGKLHEDLYITYKLLDKCKKFVYTSAPYYFYNQCNPKSICKNYGIKNFIDEFYAYSQIKKYYSNRKLYHIEVDQFLISSYISMLKNSRLIIGDSSIQKELKYITHWLNGHVLRCYRYGVFKRILLLLFINNIKTYHFIMKLVERLLE